MDKDSTSNYPPLPDGRFNSWGERKGLDNISSEKLEAVDKELSELKMSSKARSLYRAAKLTDSTGVEFVFISNTQFPSPIVFKENGIHIVPCFIPLKFVHGAISDEKQMAMMHRGYFIYDGWVPVNEWTIDKLEQIISLLDDIVNLFSIVGKYYAYWEPKYHSAARPIPSHVISPPEFKSLAKTIGIMDNLSPTDRNALNRSIAWITNALRTESPVQRFLLLFVSIEAMVTYIERKSEKDSPLRMFAADKLSKSERKQKREDCIKEVLAKAGFHTPKKPFLNILLQAARNIKTLPLIVRIFSTQSRTPIGKFEPTQAIQQAYFDCVTGSKKMIEDHLNRVFGSSEISELIFNERVDGKTLWLLRNDIAHGNLNLLNEAEIHFLSDRVGVLEKVARNYIRIIFATLAQDDYFLKPRRPILTLPMSQGIGLSGSEYMGPTDMAEYYANVEILSSSFVKISFK